MRAGWKVAVLGAFLSACGSEATGTTASTGSESGAGAGGVPMNGSDGTGAGGVVSEGAGGAVAGSGGGGAVVTDASTGTPDVRITGGDAGPLGDGAAGRDLCSTAMGTHLHLKGMIGGATLVAVEATQDLTFASRFLNGAPGTLDSPYPASNDPNVAQAHLKLPIGIARAIPAPVQGTVRLGMSQPMGTVDICAGSGSTIYDGSTTTRNFAFSFDLVNLTSGPQCADRVFGSIAGCWTDNF